MGKVYSLWPLELKAGVDGADVEHFARETLGKLPPLPGVQFALLKADRGQHVGDYQLLVEIESVEVRNRLAPVEGPGGSSEELQQWVAPLLPMLEGWLQYVVTIPGIEGAFTDYHDVTR